MPKKTFEKTTRDRDYPILNHSMHTDLLIGVVSRFGFDACLPSTENPICLFKEIALVWLKQY